MILQTREFKVHRLILSARSNYFKNIFEGHPNQSRIELKESFDLATFDLILEHVYGGNINSSGTNDINKLTKLARLAKRLDVDLGKVNVRIISSIRKFIMDFDLTTACRYFVRKRNG